MRFFEHAETLRLTVAFLRKNPAFTFAEANAVCEPSGRKYTLHEAKCLMTFDRRNRMALD